MEREGDRKYQFVLYSPSFEIFKRMHAVFSSVPEVVENMEKEEHEQKEQHLKDHHIAE